MAIDEINAKGGVMGRKLEPVVVDPASNWPLFAEKSRQLLAQDKVAVVFGCWTSVSRKSVLPVFKELNGLLFYPVQYEGEELEKNVFYTGAAPNQQAIPAVEYLMSEDGGGAKRFVLLGTDYVYPRTTNKILRAFLHSKGVKDSDIDEVYALRPFRLPDHRRQHQEVRHRRQDRRHLHHQRRLQRALLQGTGQRRPEGHRRAGGRLLCRRRGTARRGHKPLVGHLAAWNYFESIKTPVNTDFIAKWKAYAKAKNLPTPRPWSPTIRWRRPTSASTWKQAVEQAKSTDVDKVIAAMGGQTFSSPSGFEIMMDKTNHHLHKPVYIGEIKADGQFNVVWKSKGPIRAQPWSPYIPGNEGKQGL